MITKFKYIAWIGAFGLQLFIANHASAYICTGTGIEFTDPLCDADEISADLGVLFDDTLLAKDDDPLNPGAGLGGNTEYGILDVTQLAGGGENEVRFTYEGITPQVIVEKADGWYSVYNWDTQIMEGDGFYYFLRDFGDFNCDSQGINCNAATSHVSAYGVVPVPAAAWLFGSGLLGLVGISRRRKPH